MKVMPGAELTPSHDGSRKHHQPGSNHLTYTGRRIKLSPTRNRLPGDMQPSTADQSVPLPTNPDPQHGFASIPVVKQHIRRRHFRRPFRHECRKLAAERQWRWGDEFCWHSELCQIARWSAGDNALKRRRTPWVVFPNLRLSKVSSHVVRL